MSRPLKASRDEKQPSLRLLQNNIQSWCALSKRFASNFCRTRTGSRRLRDLVSDRESALMRRAPWRLRICDPRSSFTILMIHKMSVHAARNQCTPPQAGLTRSALIQGGDVQAFATCFHIAMLSTCVFACRNALLWAWRRARRDSKKERGALVD